MANAKSTPKPIPPKDNECCQSGCNPCVWDNYYEKLKQWRFTQVKVSLIDTNTDKKANQ